MTIGTEITLASIIQLLLTAGGIIYAWADTRGRIATLEGRLEKAEDATRDANTRLAGQQESFALYREQQARELVTREILRDVEKDLKIDIAGATREISGVRERMDDLYNRLIPRGGYPAS